MNLQLKKFDMRMIPPASTCMIVAKRGQGKSTLIKDLMYYKQDIPVGTVISATEPSNCFFEKFVPRMFIHFKYDTVIIQNFLKRQKKLKKRIKRGEHLDNRAYLIFDDMMYDQSWKKDQEMREIFFNSRHFETLFVCALQDPMGIPPNFRGNIDFVFLLKENNRTNKEKLWKHYAAVFPTYEMFSETLDQCTNNRECLVINNTANAGRLEEQVFWYKAELHNDFHVGPEEIWNISEQNYMDDDDDDEEININTYNAAASSKRKGPHIKVKKV
jgi:hypothetical protein